MSELLRRIDARTKLAGANKLEILLFTLGVDVGTQRKEIFGINVFKVREVMRIPEITRAPDMPPAVEGMVSLRGVLVPVVDLAKYIGIQTDAPPSIMIVTEYNRQTQGFLVGEVDTILRIDWADMKVPPAMLTAKMGGLVTAVTELPDKQLVMMLDVKRSCRTPPTTTTATSMPTSPRSTVRIARCSIPTTRRWRGGRWRAPWRHWV